ncbi:MAG TPA: hypothetical protein PLL33_06800, partial [Paracoccus sp. (in: a-proteobacteria)]|nr:hypothetical protein [Paracoccus sp. (in: a-proteobacteria)]
MPQVRLTGAGRRGHARPWSREEDDQLRSLWTAGETLTAIAAALGRSMKAVDVHRGKLGLPARGSWGGKRVETAPVEPGPAVDEVEEAAAQWAK